MHILVREAHSTDAPTIARVHVDSWRTTYRGIVPDDYLARLSYDQREEVWRSILSKTDGSEIVYVDEDRKAGVVGFASGGPERSGDPIYAVELYAIYVLVDSQRKGIGRWLTSAVAARLSQDGMQSMLVWVLEQNQPARRFYEALGGMHVREQGITIGGTTLLEVAYG